MGQPKLLLPLAGKPLVLHTLAAWQQSKVNRIVVIARPGDDELASIVRAAGVDLVIPATPPPDMKASLQSALTYVEQTHNPCQADAFLVAPADMPQLSPSIIDRLLEQHPLSPQRILVPTLAGRGGHPVLFPWPLAVQVHALADHEGIDALVHRHDPLLVPCDGIAAGIADVFFDIDTPDDLQRMTNDK